MKNQAPKLPSKVDLRDKFGPVFDQGQLGSSGACAMAAAISSVDRRRSKFKFQPSRLFLYYHERILKDEGR